MSEKISDLAVIVVAGGSSLRYGRNKLLEKLGDAPVIVHALRNYRETAGQLVVAAAPAFRARYEALFLRYLPGTAVTTVDGGDCRAESVLHALGALDKSIVYAAVHDAARPLGSAGQLKRLYDFAVAHRCGAISGRKIVDSVKRVSPDGFIEEGIAREGLFRAETPQLFEAEKLRAALEKSARTQITDDAEAMQFAGFPVAVIEDPDPNPKLTVPEDLLFMKKWILR